MKEFRTVVVGTGFIGPVHVEALRRAGVTVAGIVGSSPEKSTEASKALGLPATYPTLESVLNDPTIDAVHLATPNRLHFEQAAAVLRSGKHVVCEKPLAMTSRQSAELVEIAAASGRAAAVAYNIRFYPLCHEAAARVAGGSVGEFLHVSGSYVQDWLLCKTDFNWRVLAEDGGELRAVADIGTHWLDLIQFITGQRVVAVCADLRTVYPQRERPIGNVETFSGSGSSDIPRESVQVTTEDCGSVMLKFSGGANGCMWVSQTTAGRKNCLRFEIGGTEQCLAWNSQSPNELFIGQRDCANESLIRDPALLQPQSAALCNYPGGHNEGFPDTFKQLFRCFYGSIADQSFATDPPFPTFADGHHEVLLCEAILTSHRKRTWVDVAKDQGDHQ
ncbi:Gfo/Idh/MocA family oxidoreductase [Roseiconus nitratireducens]|uniref:Gfo/Idh/MocA family oxidoreductase n=1 Tax=Roseiconus nitratireducens TaxID=2605748 RepID=A0A5M6CZ65_9BACT|nr:Gfo/Idh/MocA family oxidoreductase [Roseiconus nitratireducens]KAA5540527.1 Gfo/Idh/MocA family oxidoreductase [Roseiconus nitratireducens]